MASSVGYQSRFVTVSPITVPGSTTPGHAIWPEVLQQDGYKESEK